MVTNRWILRVLGVMFCLCVTKAASAAAYDHMTLVMNGQLNDISVTFAPGNGEDFGWGSTPPQTSSFPSTSTKQPDINLSSAVSEEQEFFISPNRFALLAFVIAGILAARKQSQS